MGHWATVEQLYRLVGFISRMWTKSEVGWSSINAPVPASPTGNLGPASKGRVQRSQALAPLVAMVPTSMRQCPAPVGTEANSQFVDDQAQLRRESLCSSRRLSSHGLHTNSWTSGGEAVKQGPRCIPFSSLAAKPTSGPCRLCRLESWDPGLWDRTQHKEAP